MSESGKIDEPIIRVYQRIAQTRYISIIEGEKVITAQQLNKQFGIKGQLSFREDASGLIVAEIDNEQSTATLCLQGAHLMSWQPKSQAQPVVA
jgi:hypothetical protein